MPPVALTAVRVYYRLDDAALTPQSARVTLMPAVPVNAPTADLGITTRRVTLALNAASGYLEAWVVRSNDPALSGPMPYRLTVDAPEHHRTSVIEILGETDLADVAPVSEPVSVNPVYLLAAALGITVAPLVGGLVPAVHLPLGLEGGLSGSGVLSAPVTVGGVLGVTVTSDWGLTSAGTAYHDPDGAAPSDAAIASLDSSGALVLTRPGEASQGSIGAGTGQVGFSAVAAVVLSGHRVVAPRPDGTLDYASNTVVAHLHAPLWVTRGAVAAGQPATVLAYGALTESSWAWTPGVPLFLGVDGLLTQTAPVAPGALFSAQVGIATGATSAFFDRQPSISLA